MSLNLLEIIGSKLTEIESFSKIMGNNHSDEKDALLTLLNDFFEMVLEAIEKYEIGQVMNVLELFQLFSSKYQYDKVLDSDLYCTAHILYFKACIFQKHWALDQLSECYSEIERVFERYLDLESAHFLKSNSSDYLAQRQLVSKQGARKISLSLIYFETLLQHTALLSQKGANLRAKEKSEKCYKAFAHLFKHLNTMIGAILLVGPTNINADSGISLKSEGIFRYIEFLKTFSIPPFSHIESKWSSDFSQWKFNKESYDKFILKTIETPITAQILKQKIEREWISGFHISSIVKLSKFYDFNNKISNPILDDDLILRLILIFSCCIFSIAAENRFIVKREILGDEQPGPPQRTTVSQELRFQKNTQFIYSEKVHLKAIELLLFGLDSNIKIISHFLNSYKKNYSFNVMVIEEENESCFSSARNSEYYEPACKGFIDESPTIGCFNYLSIKLLSLDTKQGSQHSLAEEKSRTVTGPLDTGIKLQDNKPKVDFRELTPNIYKPLGKNLFIKTSFSKKSTNEIVAFRPSSNERLGSLSSRRPSKTSHLTCQPVGKRLSIEKMIKVFERSHSKPKSHNNTSGYQIQPSIWRPDSKNKHETAARFDHEHISNRNIAHIRNNVGNRHNPEHYKTWGDKNNDGDCYTLERNRLDKKQPQFQFQ